MGLEPDPWDILQHSAHNHCAVAIGFLMGARLLVRVLWAAPAGRPTSRTALVARALHLALYAAVIGQAGFGFIARYLTFRVAPLHVVGSWVILAVGEDHCRMKSGAARRRI